MPRRRRKKPWGWITLAIIVIAGGFAARAYVARSRKSELPSNAFFEVKRKDLLISVTEEGALRALNETVVRSSLDGYNRIISLIPEGSVVKKGDLLVELDSSALRLALHEQELAYQDKLFFLLQARESVRLQLSLAESQIKEGELRVDNAQSELEKYKDGDAPLLIRTAEARIRVLEEQVRIATERHDRTAVLFKNGNATKSEVEADSLTLKRERLGLEQYREDLRLVQKFDHPNKLRLLESNVRQAESELIRLKARHANESSQTDADLRTSQKALDIMEDTLEQQRRRVENTKIIAPQDGIVVYATSSPFQDRGNPVRDDTRRVREGAMGRLAELSGFGGGGNTSFQGGGGGGGRRGGRGRGGSFGDGGGGGGGGGSGGGNRGGNLSTATPSAASSGGAQGAQGSTSAGNQASASGAGSSTASGGETQNSGSTSGQRSGSGGSGSSSGGGSRSGGSSPSFTSFPPLRQSSLAPSSTAAAQNSAGGGSAGSSSGSSGSTGGGGNNAGGGSQTMGFTVGSSSRNNQGQGGFFDRGFFDFSSSSGIIEEGTMVRQRQEIIRLPDISRMLAEVKIQEGRVGQIRAGMSAWVRVETLPGRRFKAIVRRVGLLPDAQSNWMNPDSKVYATDILIEDELPLLKPGVSARAEIIITNLPNVLSVPIQAVSSLEGEYVCFAKRGSKVTPVPVTTGWFNDQMIEIKSGLKEGDRVLLAPISDEDLFGMDSNPASTNKVESE